MEKTLYFISQPKCDWWKKITTIIPPIHCQYKKKQKYAKQKFRPLDYVDILLTF